MRRGVAAAAPLAVVLLLVAVPPTTARAAFKNVEIGRPAPGFRMKDLAGREWESASHVGSGVTVVVFWATWSPRSREILSDLERLRSELGPERLSIVAVNVEHQTATEADRDAIRAFVAETRTTATVLLDEGLAAFNAFGTMAVPSSLVIGTGGTVTYALAGYPTTQRSDLADAARKALGLPTSVELRPPQPYVPKNHALMYYNFGRRLMEKGQDEKAVEQLKLAVERDPAYKLPHLELGRYYRRSGRPREALAEFSAVRELDPADPEVGYQAAVLSLEQGDRAGAEALFARLSAEYPANGEYVLGQALAVKYQGREGEYRALRSKASGLQPAAPRFDFELGQVAERNGDLGEALTLFRQGAEAALKAAGR